MQCFSLKANLVFQGFSLITLDDQVCFWYNHQRILRALPFGFTTKTHLKTFMSKPPPPPYPLLPLVFKALQEQARFREVKTKRKHRQSASDAKYHLFTVLSLQCIVEFSTKVFCRCCLDCQQSLFSQSSLSSAGLERAKWPRGKLERGGKKRDCILFCNRRV